MMRPTPTEWSATIQLEEWFLHKVENPAIVLAGGRARLRVIVLLACTLALDSADKAMIGAVAVSLEQAMDIGYLQLALLIAVPTLITAVATLPFGALADRVDRVKLLTLCIFGWAILMAISGAAISYLMLLLTRLVLGALIAVTVPVIASLIGDYFNPGERARIWGYILAGELVGVAIGYLIAGNIAAVLSWRASFWVLAALSLALVPLLWRFLSEPARGGQSRIPPGAARIPDSGEGDVPEAEDRSDDEESKDQVEASVEQRGVQPYEALVLRNDPAALPFRDAVRYVLSIHSNVVLIVASALGYLFFGSVVTFGIVFMRNRFELGQAMATTLSVGLGAGAIVGVLVSGRLADWLIGRGRISARVVVAAVAFLLTAALFLPALLMSSIFVAAPLLFLGAIGLGGTNPSLDAARLDIMHYRLWGRSESVRAALRFLAQAFAPLIFAGTYILLSGSGSLAGIATGNIKQGGGALADTFLIMLIPVVAAGCILFLAKRSYPRDVATARTSEQAFDNDDD